MARKTTPAWLYIVLALIAGLALGGLIFTWVRPFPGGSSASVPTTAAPSTVSPSTPPPSTPTGQSSQPSTTLTPPPEDDQSQSRPARRSPAKPTSRPSPAAGTSDAPPMTERPPIVTSPVPVPPPVTPGPVPPPATASASPSSAANAPAPAGYSPNRPRAVQETDSEAGLTVPSSPSGAATGRPALSTRQSNNNSDSSGRPVLHRARNSEDTDSPSQSSAPQAPAAAVPSGRPAYNGPTSGTATWTGKLEKNETLTINGGIPSVGILAGAGLPGVPVTITVDQTNLGFAEMPGASNNYGRLVLKSHSKHDKIVLHWTVIQ